jgi:hypothetical protein
MPAPLLHLGAQVLCSHGGMATPTSPNPRVLLNGQPSVVLSTPYVVAGCALSSSGTPCVSGQWLVAATRVFSQGQPLVLQTSTSTCVPNGTPLLPLVAQTRVLGT